MEPTISIGMATYDDFDGVYFTVEALRMYHPEAVKGAELIIVDNNPKGPHSESLRAFMGWIHGDFVAAQYLPFDAVVGTSMPRDLVFKAASAPYVLCMDSHVMLWPGALKKLLDYYQQWPTTQDLLAGPIMYDDLKNFSTHFDSTWEAEMWGHWGTDLRAEQLDAPPVQVGAMGLGLFTCRRDAWQGFNPAFRGFGGEEWYIHEKFRRKGARCLCLPFLRWLHRFGRPDGVKYPITRWNKVRNYVIGHQELGWDLAPIYDHFVKSGMIEQWKWDAILKGEETDPGVQPSQNGAVAVPASVVAAPAVAPAAEPAVSWQLPAQSNAPQVQIPPAIQPANPFSSPVVHPVVNPEQPKKGCGGCPGAAKAIPDLYAIAAAGPGDFFEHVPTLRSLGDQVQHATEFGVRHGVSTVALLHSSCKTVVSYDIFQYAEVNVFRQVAADKFVFKIGNSLTVDIDPTDLLFIDTKHTAAQLYGELTKHATRVRRWIVMHDTVTFGNNGEDGGPGLREAIKAFLKANKEWFPVRHDQNNNGLMVLSRDPSEKKPLPTIWRQGWNILRGGVKAVLSAAVGNPMASSEEKYEKRLSLCTLCPSRHDERCAECGCWIGSKAAVSTEECPLGIWEREGA
jgi:hypothetical protein